MEEGERGREGGEERVAVPGLSIVVDLGVEMGDEGRFACGMGRRRLRIEVAAEVEEMGSVTVRWRGGVAVGRFGGEGGGEC